MAATNETAWGRVDDDGTVYVRTADGERVVGQYPDGTAEEALAYFTRKFDDLASQVTLAEQRAKRGASPADVARSVTKLREAVTDANAVGDLAALATRLEALDSTVAEKSAAAKEEAAEAQQAAITERTAIAEAMEALAARDLSSVQWRQMSADIDELFQRWQTHQSSGPRLPKSTADALWKRFKSARGALETARRTYFHSVDQANRVAKTEKTALIEAAEALAPQGTDGIPAYRKLLDQWKLAGRASRKLDDQLWARFKAAGDVLYQAKADEVAAENVEFEGNLAAKIALLDEGQAITKLTDRAAARKALGDLQRRYDEIGFVPRGQVREVEAKMRAIEDAVKGLEESHWRDSNPERKERSDGFAGQLEAAIEALDEELAAATAAGNKAEIKRVGDELAAKKSWLAAVRP